MKKTASLLIIISVLFLTGMVPFHKGGDYRIYVEKSDKAVAYKADDFYSVYYIYMNVIRALNVNERLKDGDVGKTISLIIDNLKKGNVVQLQVDGYRGKGGTLRVTMRPERAPKGDKPILLVMSNYDARTKEVVSDDDEKNAYATFFYLSGNKLVKNRYVHEPKSEDELKRMPVNNRADYYLLDGEPANDATGKDLLLKEVEKQVTTPDRVLAYMTLSEYHLLAGDVRSAKQCLDKARALIGELKDEKKKASLLNVLRYADDLYRYYVGHTGRS